jgi:hypothetical protein
MTNKNLKFSHQRRDMVTCGCGAEIELLPNVKAMSEAIEVHVALHMQKAKGLAAAGEAERVEDALIAKVFERAIQSEDQKTYKKSSN